MSSEQRNFAYLNQSFSFFSLLLFFFAYAFYYIKFFFHGIIGEK